MPWKETLYERRLRRPLDEPTKREIEAVYQRRRHEIPMPTELHWHPAKPQFTIKGQWLSFVGRFTPETFVVDAELSLMAKMMATDEHRHSAVRLITSLADELGL